MNPPDAAFASFVSRIIAYGKRHERLAKYRRNAVKSIIDCMSAGKQTACVYIKHEKDYRYIEQWLWTYGYETRRGIRFGDFHVLLISW